MQRRHCTVYLAAAICKDSFAMTDRFTDRISDAMLVERASAWSFALTLDRLTAAIEGAGMTVFARIDHAAGAKEAGLTLAPTVVLLYGSPKGGTPLMLAAPAAALDLPLRVLVKDDADGRTQVSFHPVVPMLMAAGVPEPLARRLEPAQALLLRAIQP
jgi:uncharacterized protein (DUF302 family)